MPHLRRRKTSNQEEPIEPAIKHIAHEPSLTSRLGDIGYIDKQGMWQKIVNILDQNSCHQLGIKAIQLATDLFQYIKQGRHSSSEEPCVNLNAGGSYQLVTPNELVRYTIISRFSHFRTLPKPQTTLGHVDQSAQAAMCTLGLIIYPPAESTITAFVAGLQIFARTLNLPYKVLHAWLHTYNPQILKSARNHMEHSPPADRSQTLCLSLTEFYAEAWRTLYIRADAKGSPLALGWKPAANDIPGTWIIFEVPASGTVVCAGFSSSGVGSTKQLRGVILMN